MKKTLLSLSLALAFAAPSAFAAEAPKLGSFGIDLSNRDNTVQPGDDFNRHANGTWFDNYQLKDYETRYGSFNTLSDQAELQVKAIIEELQARTDLAPGSDEQKVRDLYASYMDTAARDAAGITPIQPILDGIAKIDSVAALTAAFGRAGMDGSNAPVGGGVGLDRKDPNRYLVGVGVGGLGLPDKDFYLNPEPRFVQIRTAYLAHIEKMLGFAGITDAKPRAEAILALETEIAKNHWDRAQLRDRDKTYNLTSFEDLKTQFPAYDWAAHFTAQGLPTPAEVNVTTPSAVGPILEIVGKTPLNVWRDYLTFHTVDNHAPLLSTEIDQAAFAFNGTVLSGQRAQREQWKRGVALVGGGQGLGDAVGKVYVARHFQPEAKAAMDALVENLRKALRQNIDNLDWMGAATKEEAYKKLESFRPKIGYPTKWRDYASVTIVPNDFMANVLALRQYYTNDQNRRLGTVPDRDEWFMTPHTVNAYYNATFNEIVFPAAILQPPFFDVNADPAVNYGAIGGVIGHEMGHGFDDQGSKSDWQGIQRNWWTDEDRARFDARTRALVAQYNQFCPLEGYCVNGQLGLGENIGDLGGLSMAYTAYQMSLNGQPAPVLDGLTGDQRFFLAWAQIWKSKYRDEAMINQVKVGPHSPPQFRINGPLRNLDEWYKAFNVQPDDALYLKPEERVRIW
ncbi:M13 family metallopeptidase [Silanimonas sp.]|jgi:predicted metalloendopeptidase|uniref:M13 family metallopeptidase n=1 Tax=Silanimonas sp. TaxID=1929290 RepID=UPI0022CCCAE6|nr:M13 family metallopeptidase [Silanimonas sp.]MCZ8064062.1 M13 family metallopeptidase [Silanimonas sp.]